MRHGSLLWRYIQTARRAFLYASPVVWRPNPRLLLCGMVGFLWERERITVEEVMRCLEDYEDRLRWQLHSERATIASSTTGPRVGVSQNVQVKVSRGEGTNSAPTPCDAHVSSDEATMDTEEEEPRATGSECSKENGLGTSASDGDDGVDGLGPRSEDEDGEGGDWRTSVVGLEEGLGNEGPLVGESCSSGESIRCYICEGVEVTKEQLLRTYEERLGLGTTSIDRNTHEGDLMWAGNGGMDADLPTPSVVMDTTGDILDTITSHRESPLVSCDTSRDEELGLLVGQKGPLSGWEFMADEGNCKVYKKPHGETGLNKYKVIGAYDDITAKDFLDVQVDHDARKEWDAYVVKLATVDKDPASGCEVIHWIMKYPFPMQNREYLYVRKFWISRTENAIVLINRSVTHPSIPESRRYVRVHRYFSEMVIRPHTFIDELGFDFELTYFDDPQSYLPSSYVNWVTTTAMPDFLNQIHNAALNRIAAGDLKKHAIGA